MYILVVIIHLFVWVIVAIPPLVVRVRFLVVSQIRVGLLVVRQIRARLLVVRQIRARLLVVRQIRARLLVVRNIFEYGKGHIG
jgi:hypothetical protein